MPTQPQPFVPWLSVATQALQGRQKRQDVDYERNQEERAYNDQQALRQQQMATQADATQYARAQDRRRNERQDSLDLADAYDRGFIPQEQAQSQGRRVGDAPQQAQSFDTTGVGLGQQAAGNAVQQAPSVYSIAGKALVKGRNSVAEQAAVVAQQNRAAEQQEARRYREQDLAAATAQRAADQAFQAGENAKNRAVQMRGQGLRPAPTPKALTSIPPSMVDAMAQTHAAISSIDDAISTVASGKADGHIGPSRRFLPNFVSQMTDPGGNEIRGRIASIGSVIRHDLSGAAVSPSEMKMLEPNIPDPTDPPQAAHEKLTRLRKQLSIIDADKRAYYSEENGYRSAPRSSLTPEASAAPSAPPNPTQFPAGASPIPGGPRSLGDLVKR